VFATKRAGQLAVVAAQAVPPRIVATDTSAFAISAVNRTRLRVIAIPPTNCVAGLGSASLSRLWLANST
jgi:hypothetical protein